MGFYIYQLINGAKAEELVLSGILDLVFWPLVALYLMFYGLAKFLEKIIDG
jgi:hypothetical protein